MRASGKSVDLVLLKCLRCGTLVQAGEQEVAWVCAQCAQGLQLTVDGLGPLSVNWAAARPGLVSAQNRWLPFWVFTGAVRFNRREAFSGANQPDRLWSSQRRFYIPACPAALEQMQRLGADLTRKQTPLIAGPAAGPLANCTLFPDDARQAAEFVVLTIEADQKDKLRVVEFALDLGEPELWVLPFEEQGDLRPALAE